jgi:hypothetical protein
MILAFKLTMPRNNSWNGRWSGDEKLYVKTKTFLGQSIKKAEKLVGSHHYDFGDGWCAQINVSIVDSSQARRLNKNSLGFCGYDWMIDSLITYGDIIPDSVRFKKQKASNDTNPV